MRKKTGISMATVSLLLLTAFLTPQLIGIKTVEAGNNHIIWGSTYYSSTSEDNYAGSVANSIMNWVVTYGDYQWALNAFKTLTERPTIDYLTEYSNDNYDETNIFYKGHGCYWWENGYRQYYFLDDDGLHVEDNAVIYPNTDAGGHDFVFQWNCASAQEVGGPSPSGGHGMAYCWTREVLEDDGYGDPDTNADEAFIGFLNNSPDFLNETGYNNKDMGDFVLRFYERAVRYHDSINDALDAAANYAFDEDFGDAWIKTGYWYWSPEEEDWFWSYMQVFGNGEKVLPY